MLLASVYCCDWQMLIWNINDAANENRNMLIFDGESNKNIFKLCKSTTHRVIIKHSFGSCSVKSLLIGGVDYVLPWVLND